MHAHAGKTREVWRVLVANSQQKTESRKAGEYTLIPSFFEQLLSSLFIPWQFTCFFVQLTLCFLTSWFSSQLVTAVLKPKEGKFTFDVRNKFLPQRAGGASTAAQRSCGAPSLEALKARLEGPWAAWAGGRQPCPRQGVGLGGLWDPFLPGPFFLWWFYDYYCSPTYYHTLTCFWQCGKKGGKLGWEGCNINK